MKKFALVFFLLISFSALSQAELITVKTLWSLKRVSDPRLSPDGTYLLATVTSPRLDSNDYVSDLFLVNLKTGETKRLTREGNNSNGRWSPDGKRIAFISDRDGSRQVYLMDLSGGDPEKITDMKKGVAFLDWSPDGKFLSFVSDVKVGPSLRDLYPDLPKLDAYLFKDLPVRHWDEWTDAYWRHLFVLKLGEKKPLDLMKNEPYDTPMKPFGGPEQIAWAPKGVEIAYTSKKVKDYETSTNSSIYTVSPYGGKSLDITQGSGGFPLESFDFAPKYSPNGKFIAFLSQKRPGFESDKIRLLVYSRKTGRYYDLTKKFDNWVSKFVWSPRSNYVYFSSIVEGRCKIFRASVPSGKIKTILEGPRNYGDRYLDISPNGKTLFFSVRSYNYPTRVASMPIGGDEEDVKIVFDPNEKVMAKINKAKIEERKIRVSDGKEVQAWIIFPPNFNPKKKYPTLVYCQGGPQQAVSQYWSYGWNFLLMASKGYVVFAPNRRGCPGFGQEWVDAISKDWGGRAMLDIMETTDSIANEPWIDKNKIAAIGGSAGGFTTFWLEGHNENKRFKAFVSHCGVFNIESKHGGTDEQWFPNWEFGGEFLSYEARQQYKKFSPSEFADKWNAPILIITGEKDYRVPYDQSLQAFTLAQNKGLPSELIVYPNENHWTLKPQNKVFWYKEFFKFLDKYCAGK